MRLVVVEDDDGVLKTLSNCKILTNNPAWPLIYMQYKNKTHL